MEFLNIKLFAFDIDGTLIPEDGSAKSDEPTTRLIKALIKLKIVFHPCTLAIATGRSVPEVYEFSTRFPKNLFSYGICSNGKHTIDLMNTNRGIINTLEEGSGLNAKDLLTLVQTLRSIDSRITFTFVVANGYDIIKQHVKNKGATIFGISSNGSSSNTYYIRDACHADWAWKAYGQTNTW